MNTIFSPHTMAGSVSAVPSKSYAHRLLLAAALCEGTTTISCPLLSQDISATAGSLKALGCDVGYEDGNFTITPPREYTKNATFDCVECGTLLRFCLPIISALGVGGTLIGRGRLPSRPLSPLCEELIAHGVSLSSSGLPMSVGGTLKNGDYTLAANVSSQFIGGLLMALPLLSGDSRLSLMGTVESRPYIDMTLDVLRLFQIQIIEDEDGQSFSISGNQRYRSPNRAVVEGDWSNAAFWLAAGAMGADISMTNLKKHSLQGDSSILSVLQGFGASHRWEGDVLRVTGASLHGQDIDCAQIPDLVPILAVVASTATGTTRFYNAERLRLKESDRIATTCALLTNLGVRAEARQDGLVVTGCPKLVGGQSDSYNDHRIAMSAAIAAAFCDKKVLLTATEAVGKSYPHFFDDYIALGGVAQHTEQDWA